MGQALKSSGMMLDPFGPSSFFSEHAKETIKWYFQPRQKCPASVLFSDLFSRYESCNTWECPVMSKDSRLEQCQKYDGNNFSLVGIASDVKWLPKYTGILGSDRCKLFCRTQDSSAYYLLGTSVIDGTPCGPDTFDACVNGQCISAGCDHVLGSGRLVISDRC